MELVQCSRLVLCTPQSRPRRSAMQALSLTCTTPSWTCPIPTTLPRTWFCRYAPQGGLRMGPHRYAAHARAASDAAPCAASEA